MDTPETVILVDDAGSRVGTATKTEVHTQDTRLHLAFSCHVVDADGLVLVTRRALSKQTWPGVWTNSVCGHPAPDEEMTAAVRRRARFELGLELSDIQVLVPDFRYRATDASGIVENEICPIFTARTSDVPRPHPDEVMDLRWLTPAELVQAVEAAPWALSPWLVTSAPHLAALADLARRAAAPGSTA
jgi:isopentenyl-diphosphate delta-isomerase